MYINNMTDRVSQRVANGFVRREELMKFRRGQCNQIKCLTSGFQLNLLNT